MAQEPDLSTQAKQLLLRLLTINLKYINNFMNPARISELEADAADIVQIEGMYEAVRAQIAAEKQRAGGDPRSFDELDRILYDANQKFLASKEGEPQTPPGGPADETQSPPRRGPEGLP